MLRQKPVIVLLEVQIYAAFQDVLPIIIFVRIFFKEMPQIRPNVHLTCYYILNVISAPLKASFNVQFSNP